MALRPTMHRLLALIAALATNASARAEADIAIEPAAIRFDGGASRQQVAVTETRPSGEVLDRTSLCVFTTDLPEIASVSASGVVMPRRNGRATLHVQVDGRSITAPIVVEDGENPRPTSYRLDVAPVLAKAGCNMGACHGNLNGKGGFRLSLRGEDPAFDFSSMTREAFGRRVDSGRPESSLILLKPTGQVEHEGGQPLLLGSPEYRCVRDWIESGASDDVRLAPKLTRLSVWPADRYLAPNPKGMDPSQQLIVTAEFSDGSSRDVTRQTTFDLNDPIKFSVSPDGRVEASGPGEAVVAVRYLDGRGVSRLAFLADRPGFSWQGEPGDDPIDRAVFAKLKALRIRPSAPIDDGTFLRRASLDAIGMLPTSDEVRAFLSDRDPQKRSKLIDRLVLRPEFADFWALKWADLLRNEEKTMGPKGVWGLQRWLRDAIASDMPMDEFARSILTARGSTWQNPPASFHRTNADPQTAAETVGQVFLGVRLQCARCHNHPFDVWTQDDYYGLAAYFTNVKRLEINNQRRDDLDKHEINGDVMVYLEGQPGIVQPRSGRKLPPKPPGGRAPDLANNDALDDLATWLTKDNPQFSRNLANRVWFHLMGRGVVDPVDDFRDSNPPSNPELLDVLTRELNDGGMRLRPLVARIMKSRTYQFGSTPNATNAEDESNFSHASVRLLPAEVLLDALASALDKPQSYSGAPRATRAVQLPGVKMGGDFLKTFGKPERLLTCECERSESTTLAQAFQLINGESVRKTLSSDSNRIGRLLASKDSDDAILDDLYLASLTRFPGGEERQVHLSYVARSTDRRKAWEDVAWAVLNSKEFLLRH